MVPEAGGRYALKLLDFGLSSGPDGLRLADLAGTLAYMAPELLRGEPPSVVSDLYAAGMVIYEVMAGRSPFPFDGRTTGLLMKVLREPPDLSQLPPALGALLGRTLSKEPRERPADVASLLRDLCAATGTARPEEPAAVRDSFLIAARFVNRGAELDTLSRALLEVQAGRGAAWLLGGESGSGKSRLLEELRSLALLSGVVVVCGQAISDGGIAYQVWQEALRVLALHLDLSDHEVSVLGVILPGLASLLERPVALPPEEPELIDPQVARLQRLRVLREILLRVPRPVLVLLEDLHWADVESLALLAQVTSNLSACPLLIVASYRDDETPRLPSTLPGARVLRLERLVRHELARLCESMLGEPGRDPLLLDRIERETEGNLSSSQWSATGGVLQLGRVGVLDLGWVRGVGYLADLAALRACSVPGSALVGVSTSRSELVKPISQDSYRNIRVCLSR